MILLLYHVFFISASVVAEQMSTNSLFPFMYRGGSKLSDITQKINGYISINGTGDLAGLNDYGMLVGFENVQLFFPLNAENRNFMYFRIYLEGYWRDWMKVTGNQQS